MAALTPTPTPTSVPLAAAELASTHPRLKIFPPYMTKNCILRQPRPQRPPPPQSVLPSLRSPAFFHLHNWWGILDYKSPRLVQWGPPGDLWTPQKFFVRLRRRPRPPRPSVSPATAVGRRALNALLKRRTPKTIRFDLLSVNCHFPE